jgi:hypothetical protein
MHRAQALPAASRIFSRGFYNPRPQEEDARPLDAKFWSGKSAIPMEKFQIDMSKYDLKKILSAKNPDGSVAADPNLRDTQLLREHMDELYLNVGAVHLINTGMTSGEEFQAVTKVLMDYEERDYEGGANLRLPIEKNVFDTGVPMESQVQYHHEMAYVSTSCKWVAFGSLEATADPWTGATFISENIGATDMLLDSKFGQKLVEKGCCYIRKLPDQKYFQDNNLDTSIVYNYWQTSTGVEDMDQAAEIMRSKGLEVEWEDSPIFGRYMVTKYYVDTFEYDPYNDRNTMYASIADDYAWFDTWPGLKDLPHWERPLKLNFGNGEVMTREDKQFWVDCYDKNGVPILWKKGDLAIICNYRTAHGRPPMKLENGDKRDLAVILGETYERQGELDGKF